MTKARLRFRAKEDLVKSDKLVFVFTALGTKMSIYRLFIKALNRRGYSCVIYDYPVSIINDGKLSEWHAFFDDILADVNNRITIKKQMGYTNFYAHGTSMGTLMASFVGRKCPQITHTVLNLTYGDVAYNIFTSRPPRKAKQKFVKQGIAQESLADELAYIDPIKVASEFRGKKVLLYLSKPDGILNYDDTIRTREALEKAGAQLTYYENRRAGHYLGAAKNLLGMKRLLAFFES